MVLTLGIINAKGTLKLKNYNNNNKNNNNNINTWKIY